MSYQTIIYKYLDQLKILGQGDEGGGWAWGYNLQSKNTPFGWLGASGMRRARELAEKGLIETRIKDRMAQYRVKSN